jgi:cag pathogenicity island protein 25
MFETMFEIPAANLGQLNGVDQPAPNFSGPGVQALQSISGIVMALALTSLVIAGIVAGAMIAYGHFARHSEAQTKGLKGVLFVVAAAAVLGSVAALINWGSGLHVVS